MKDLRIVVSCVTFEVAKVVKPILFYRADRAILIHWGGKPPYTDFIKEVKKRLKAERIPFEERTVMILDFSEVMREVRSIIRKERSEGNHVYVNIGAGPQVFSSAAMIACMMEGAIPFNANTKEFTVPSDRFFENGAPIGIARDVHDPKEIPVFAMSPPDPELIRGLAIWNDVISKVKGRATGSVMSAMMDQGILEDIYEDDRRKRISQGALMKYRRNFLEKWEVHGWILKGQRGKYSLTPQGEMMLRIFA
jgi:hypothetical protein